MRRGCVPYACAGLVALAVATLSHDASADGGLRAVGWFKGKAEITEGRINCEIPNVDNAIADGAFVVGLWNTFGTKTIQYPDIDSPYGNPCGVWVQLANGLANERIAVDRIALSYRLQNATGFRASVPTQRSFPYDCRRLRRSTVFVAPVLGPLGSSESSSSSGGPDVAFVEVLPLVPAQLLACLRAVYTPHMGTSTGLVLQVRAVAAGTSDDGRRRRSNTIAYTLFLRHSCGNGRVDDGEACDPGAPNTCRGLCDNGHCSQAENVACATDADCVGQCVAPDDPSECTCTY